MAEFRPMKTKPAFSYLRVSSKGQEKGDGFDRQRDAINAFAKANGFQIIQEFADNGVSGCTDGYDREGLTELMIALKANGVKTIIVENASRLARKLMVQEVILDDCRKNGFVVFDTTGNDLTAPDDDPTRTLIRQVLGSVAQFEKSLLVQKLAASRRRIRKKGVKCEGAKNYQELNHPAVARTLELRLNRVSFQKIADTLNSEGISTLRGSKWLPTQIQRIYKQSMK